MKKFLIQIFAFLAVVLFLGNLIALVVDRQLGKSKFYKTNFIANLGESNSKFNYVLFGSSRGLTTLDTRLIDSTLSIKGINGSMDDTGLPSHFLMIQHFFESGSTADYCVLTIDQGHMKSSGTEINDNDYRFVPYSSRDYVLNYYQQYEKGIVRPLSSSRYFPLLAYSYYNMELFYPGLISWARPAFQNRFDEKGDYTYPDDSTHPPAVDRVETLLTVISNPLLLEVQEYLKSKNCKLILYIAPYYGKRLEVSNPNSFPLINHSEILKETSVFYDVDHVNPKGKLMATQQFISDFQEYILR